MAEESLGGMKFWKVGRRPVPLLKAQGVQGGIAAAQQYHKVIMAPSGCYYFDHYQGYSPTEPIAIGGFTPVKQVYTFDPVPDTLTEEQEKYIYGVEGTLWTEYIASPQKAEYMLLPRLLALAEVAWTPQIRRNWHSFWKRLQPQFKRFEVLGVDYGKQYKGRKPQFKKLRKKK